MTFQIEDRLTRPEPATPERKSGDETGPTRPDLERPKSENELTRRLQRVDPQKAERYRQRSGQ